MHREAREKFDDQAASLLTTLALMAVAGLAVLVWLACFLCEARRPPRWKQGLAERYMGYEVAKFRSYDQGLRAHPLYPDSLKRP